MEIQTGKQDRPQKVLIYGVEGIGKSTLASKFPAPIFIDVEDRTAHLSIDRFSARNYAQVMESILYLNAKQHNYKTCVVDTIDWLEQMAEKHVCEAGNKNGIEDFGYGKGYTYMREAIQKVLQELHLLQYKKGMHILLLAHAQIKKFDDPQLGVAYDRYQLKCHEKVSSIFREWADAVLFANYQTITVEGKDKIVRGKAGRNRMLFCQHTAAFDAKNSYGLPDEIDMDYEILKPYIQTDFAGKATYTPASAAETEAAKKKAYKQALDLCGGNAERVKEIATTEAFSFKDSTVEECERFVFTVQGTINNEMANNETTKEKENTQ
jgi:hypothetical protein